MSRWQKLGDNPRLILNMRTPRSVKNARKYTFTLLACSFGLAVACNVASAQTAAKPAPAKPAVKKAAPAAAKAKLPPGIVWRGDRATERAFVADLAKQYELSKLGKVTMQPFSTIS